jgi:hypothetical protein
MIETRIENPEKHETVTADSQGRVSLGVEYAAQDVEIVVVDAADPRSENEATQQTIGEGPMTHHERKGMLFVRTFGIRSEFLKEEHFAETDEEGHVDQSTVSPVDVDWSRGFLSDPQNVARFEFDEEKQGLFSDKLVAEPARVTVEEHTGEPVYRYENDSGGSSAVAREYADNVSRIFGYDPGEALANVRVDPDEAPTPVLFRDPESEAYVAIAPRIGDSE